MNDNTIEYVETNATSAPTHADAVFWDHEVYYITSINPADPPPKEFGYRTQSFINYCNMQADSAQRYGFPEAAETIRQHIAFAEPDQC